MLIGKDRSGDGNCYFAGRSFFSRARTRMTCNSVTRWRGLNDAFSPYQAGSSVSCLVYHDLPALDDFWHESPRKCAETPRQPKNCRTHPQKTENRPACGYRTVFCSIGKYGNGVFSACFSAPILYHQWRKKQSLLHESPKNDTNRPQKPQNAPAAGLHGHKKGTAAPCCAAVPAGL